MVNFLQRYLESNLDQSEHRTESVATSTWRCFSFLFCFLSLIVQALPEKLNKLTAACHLTTLDRLAFGADNGQIYLLPALKLILHLFLEHDQSEEDFRMYSSIAMKLSVHCSFDRFSLEIQTLSGHEQMITALIHPHSEYSRYEIQHLLSASLDHSVRLWDLSTGHQLHVFTVHSGPVIMFHIPPPMLNVKCRCFFEEIDRKNRLNLGESSILCLFDWQ